MRNHNKKLQIDASSSTGFGSCFELPEKQKLLIHIPLFGLVSVFLLRNYCRSLAKHYLSLKAGSISCKEKGEFVFESPGTSISISRLSSLVSNTQR